ncbi:MAG: 16S rRNA (cytosine(967)-C(5))-methyltransferase RsmB [Proteobacteria bacterium]|nr:16S rRNA (cytosine(967)-C(5))-methyltransferase RsmB [Pseudomonadota bacterium]MBU1715562.1 16S rRNA (cytosine(967)-C(5))-methyltransferase RsmB [Pseudomonadota bacterium]
MNNDARYVALEILCRWHNSGWPIDQVRDEFEPQSKLMDPRDWQLCMAMVYGVVRWLGYLDSVLADYSKQPLAKLKKEVLQGLRIGLYQMLFMDRIPVSAAVNETVKALKAARQPRWITGYVNGLLRNIDRNRAKLPIPNGEDGGSMADHALVSHPTWLFERWTARYGREQALALCRKNNELAILCLAALDRSRLINQLAEQGIRAEAGLFSPQAVYLPDYEGQVAEIPGFTEGLFQVQDEAAQLVVYFLHPLITGTYLDACAGLGGKTGQLARMLPAKASLVAVEPNINRLKLLAENLHRLDLSSRVEIVEGTIESLPVDLISDKFAGILVDAPCSGLGVVKRHPDIRWNRQPHDLVRFRQQQLALLDSAAALLMSDGILVYATCSMEPEENEEVVTEFLSSHPDFRLSSGRDFLPEQAKSLVDQQGFFKTRPDKNGLDGFFAARLEKIK